MSNQLITYTDPATGVLCVTDFTGSLQVALQQADLAAAIAAAGGYVLVDRSAFPQDKLFRSAWKVDGRKCVECPTKSKALAHDLRRAMRAAEFAPHDAIVAKAIPGEAQRAEASREAIRAKYAGVQERIDACATVAELRAALQEV